MHQTAQVGETLFLMAQSHSMSDVARVNRHGCRMPSRIPVARIKRRNKGGSKCEVGVLKARVHGAELLGRLTLLAVEDEEALCGEGRDEEEDHAKRRDL